MLPSYFISSSNTDPPLSLHTAKTGLSVNYKTNTHTWCEKFPLPYFWNKNDTFSTS